MRGSNPAMPRTDAKTLEAAYLTERLRAVLKERFGHVPADLLATALAYELASLIASAAATKADAIAAVTAFADTGADQIRAFGVGRPHP